MKDQGGWRKKKLGKLWKNSNINIKLKKNKLLLQSDIKIKHFYIYNVSNLNIRFYLFRFCIQYKVSVITIMAQENFLVLGV